MEYQESKDFQPKLLKFGFGTLLASLVIVALLFLPGPANAATAESIVAQSPVFQPGSLGVYHSLAGSNGQSFLDHITFTVFANPGNDSFDYFTLTTSGASRYGVTFSGTELWNSAGTRQFASAMGPSITGTPILAAGSYDLRVAGTTFATYSNQNFYSMAVNFSASPAPVPEPETYAMMLAGLGLIGFVAKRRKQKEAA